MSSFQNAAGRYAAPAVRQLQESLCRDAASVESAGAAGEGSEVCQCSE